MLFVEGQAKAILEEVEENNDGAPQNYTHCVGTLKLYTLCRYIKIIHIVSVH